MVSRPGHEIQENRSLPDLQQDEEHLPDLLIRPRVRPSGPNQGPSPRHPGQHRQVGRQQGVFHPEHGAGDRQHRRNHSSGKSWKSAEEQ